MSTHEQQALVPLPGASQQSHLADLEAVLAPIQAQITDLQRDYAPRDREFWQAVLDLLPGLRQAIQPFLRQVSGVSVHLLDDRIDRVGIAITAYLPRCASYAESRLQERHCLLTKLCELMTMVQKIINRVMEGFE